MTRHMLTKIVLTSLMMLLVAGCSRTWVAQTIGGCPDPTTDGSTAAERAILALALTLDDRRYRIQTVDPIKGLVMASSPGDPATRITWQVRINSEGTARFMAIHTESGSSDMPASVHEAATLRLAKIQQTYEKGYRCRTSSFLNYDATERKIIR